MGITVEGTVCVKAINPLVSYKGEKENLHLLLQRSLWQTLCLMTTKNFSFKLKAQVVLCRVVCFCCLAQCGGFLTGNCNDWAEILFNFMKSRLAFL